MTDSSVRSTDHELNLTAHRAAGASVWDRRGWDGTPESTLARWLIGSGGGALAIVGLRRRDPLGSFFATVGGSLVWWALTNDSSLSVVRQRVATALERVPWQRRTDVVHDASEDSFPASDAPSWTPTVGAGIRRRDSAAR